MNWDSKLLWQLPLAAVIMGCVGIVSQFLLSVFFAPQPPWDTSLVLLMAGVGVVGRYSDYNARAVGHSDRRKKARVDSTKWRND